MRLPFVSLGEWRKQQDEIALLRETIREKDRRLSMMGRQIKDIRRDTSKLVEDLRLAQTLLYMIERSLMENPEGRKRFVGYLYD